MALEFAFEEEWVKSWAALDVISDIAKATPG
jgi:hypothetical protein